MTNLKNLISDLFGFTDDIYQLPKLHQVKFKDLYFVSESQLANARLDLGKYENKVDSQKKQIDLLAKQYDDCVNSKKDSLDFLTEKDPKMVVTYQVSERDKKYVIDIHNFLCEYDSTLPSVSGTNYDTISLNVLKWVRSNVKYVRDSVYYGEGEFWAKAYMTLYNKVGDCEDGAILIWNMLLANGVPWQRVRLNCGSVNGGGHAYVTYCRETDNEWVVLDWCYWPNNLTMDKRKTHKEERNYFDEERNFYVWFSADKKFGYAKQTKQTIEINGAKIKIK